MRERGEAEVDEAGRGCVPYVGKTAKPAINNGHVASGPDRVSSRKDDWVVFRQFHSFSRFSLSDSEIRFCMRRRDFDIADSFAESDRKSVV